MGVLVLNASYEPLQVIPLRRAVILLLKDKAEIIEAAEAMLHSEHFSLPKPVVIRLRAYIRIPQHFPLPCTRRGVLARDLYTCQYCGGQPGRHNLTIDHILPRSRGGTTTWENVVAACAHCNRRKGDRLPEEAGMLLGRRPFRPRYGALVLMGNEGTTPEWAKYLN